MPTVGKVRIYYISPLLIVMNAPDNGTEPTIVLRHPGEPTEEEWLEIKKVLRLCSMGLVGRPGFRYDNLWYHVIREEEEGDGREELQSTV